MKPNIFSICFIQILTSICLAQQPMQLADINATPVIYNANPDDMVVIGSVVFFSAFDPLLGRELWRSDGTEAGTQLVKDIHPGDNASSPRNLTVVGSILYFTANDGTHGTELWRSDGTSDGTYLVKDIDPMGSSNPNELTAVGSTLVFAANDGFFWYGTLEK